MDKCCNTKKVTRVIIYTNTEIYRCSLGYGPLSDGNIYTSNISKIILSTNTLCIIRTRDKEITLRSLQPENMAVFTNQYWAGINNRIREIEVIEYGI